MDEYFAMVIFRGTLMGIAIDIASDDICIATVVSWIVDHRRKFRSETSDNMDKWKSTARKKLSHGESQT